MVERIGWEIKEITLNGVTYQIPDYVEIDDSLKNITTLSLFDKLVKEAQIDPLAMSVINLSAYYITRNDEHKVLRIYNDPDANNTFNFGTNDIAVSMTQATSTAFPDPETRQYRFSTIEEVMLHEFVHSSDILWKRSAIIPSVAIEVYIDYMTLSNEEFLKIHPADSNEYKLLFNNYEDFPGSMEALKPMEQESYRVIIKAIENGIDFTSEGIEDIITKLIEESKMQGFSVSEFVESLDNGRSRLNGLIYYLSLADLIPEINLTQEQSYLLNETGLMDYFIAEAEGAGYPYYEAGDVYSELMKLFREQFAVEVTSTLVNDIYGVRAERDFYLMACQGDQSVLQNVDGVLSFTLPMTPQEVIKSGITTCK